MTSLRPAKIRLTHNWFATQLPKLSSMAHFGVMLERYEFSSGSFAKQSGFQPVPARIFPCLFALPLMRFGICLVLWETTEVSPIFRKDTSFLSSRFGNVAYILSDISGPHDSRNGAPAVTPIKLDHDIDHSADIMYDIFTGQLRTRLQDYQGKLFDRAFGTVGVDRC